MNVRQMRASRCADKSDEYVAMKRILTAGKPRRVRSECGSGGLKQAIDRADS